MIDPELLEMLCCPETRKDLTLATPEELASVNRAIREGRVKNRAGADVNQEASDLLIRIDREIGYLVRDDIPIMLIDEAISLQGLL
jgi:uncharacterized protein